MATGNIGRILVVDNDRWIASVVEAILNDAGFYVCVLSRVDAALVRQRVEEFRPHCVLLDGHGRGAYGDSWTCAAWLSQLCPPVSTIMFTADRTAADEARDRLSSRSQAAQFAGVLTKPFDIDELIDVVTTAIETRAMV